MLPVLSDLDVRQELELLTRRPEHMLALQRQENRRPTGLILAQETQKPALLLLYKMPPLFHQDNQSLCYPAPRKDLQHGRSELGKRMLALRDARKTKHLRSSGTSTQT